MHRAVQDHQLGPRPDAVDGAAQEQSSAVCLQIPAHVVLLLTRLRVTRLKPASADDDEGCDDEDGSSKGLKGRVPAHLDCVASVFVVHDQHINLYNTK